MRCKNCNKEISDDSTFCIFCASTLYTGAEEDDANNVSTKSDSAVQGLRAGSIKLPQRRDRIALPLVLMIVLVACGFGLYEYYQSRNSDLPIKESGGLRDNTSNYTNRAQDPKEPKQDAVSTGQSTPGVTRTNDQTPFYIVNVAAVKTIPEAEKKTSELRQAGYSAGYLWIPDYSSLSGAQFYTVYLGPFTTQYDCEVATEEYRKISPKVYGTLVSQDKRRVQINGIGKVVIKDLSSGPEFCDSSTRGGDRIVIITGDDVRIRIEPDASNEISMLYRLNKQDRAKVLNQTINTKGELWYQICYDGKAGWVIGRYAELAKVQEGTSSNITSEQSEDNSLSISLPIDNLFKAWTQLDLNLYMNQWNNKGTQYSKEYGSRDYQDILSSRTSLFNRLSSVNVLNYNIIDVKRQSAKQASLQVSYSMVFHFKNGKTLNESNIVERYVLQYDDVQKRWTIWSNYDYMD